MALLTIVLRRVVDPWLFVAFAVVTGTFFSYNVVLVIANTVRYPRTKHMWYGPAFQFLR